jgi:hypothetical protein
MSPFFLSAVVVSVLLLRARLLSRPTALCRSQVGPELWLHPLHPHRLPGSLVRLRQLGLPGPHGPRKTEGGRRRVQLPQGLQRCMLGVHDRVRVGSTRSTSPALPRALARALILSLSLSLSRALSLLSHFFLHLCPHSVCERIEVRTLMLLVLSLTISLSPPSTLPSASSRALALFLHHFPLKFLHATASLCLYACVHVLKRVGGRVHLPKSV